MLGGCHRNGKTQHIDARKHRVATHVTDARQEIVFQHGCRSGQRDEERLPRSGQVDLKEGLHSYRRNDGVVVLSLKGYPSIRLSLP